MNRRSSEHHSSSLTRIADENVFNFSRLLYTIIYLNRFAIRNVDTKQLFKQLDLELQAILSYQNQDGGFRRFKLANSQSNVKLTAFILKAFTLANRLDYPYGKGVNYIEQSIIDRAALFLINYQTNQGVFKENQIENHKKYNNYSTAYSPTENSLANEIELTIIVLIALNQVDTNINEKRMKIDFVKKKSIKYLNSMLEIVNGQEDLYTLSILTYCLNLFETDKSKIAYNYFGSRKQHQDGHYYWSKTDSDDDKVQATSDKLNNPLNLINKSKSVQATAYGLLTQILCNGFVKKEIVNWLNTNLQVHGDYLSIYDNILSIEAILNYLIYELEQKRHAKSYLKDRPIQCRRTIK